jgi:hypothetical protein
LLEISRSNIQTWNAIFEMLSSERVGSAYNPYLNTADEPAVFRLERRFTVKTS